MAFVLLFVAAAVLLLTFMVFVEEDDVVEENQIQDVSETLLITDNPTTTPSTGSPTDHPSISPSYSQAPTPGRLSMILEVAERGGPLDAEIAAALMRQVHWRRK